MPGVSGSPQQPLGSSPCLAWHIHQHPAPGTQTTSHMCTQVMSREQQQQQQKHCWGAALFSKIADSADSPSEMSKEISSILSRPSLLLHLPRICVSAGAARTTPTPTAAEKKHGAQQTVWCIPDTAGFSSSSCSSSQQPTDACKGATLLPLLTSRLKVSGALAAMCSAAPARCKGVHTFGGASTRYLTAPGRSAGTAWERYAVVIKVAGAAPQVAPADFCNTRQDEQR